MVLDGGVDGRVVVEDLPQRRPDLRTARVLGQVTAGAGPQGGEHGSVVGVGGERDHLDLGHAFAQQAGGLDAVAAGHPQVHEDDVGEQFGGQGDGLGTVTGGTHDIDIRQQAQHQGQPFPDHALVVSDEHAHRPSHVSTIMSAQSCQHLRPESAARPGSRRW